MISYLIIMMIINGILSLQEIMNPTTSSINPEELSLEPIKERIPVNPVSDNLPRYEQVILYGGCKLSIQVPAVEMASLMLKT